MSMRDYAVNDYGLVMTRDMLKTICSKYYREYTEEEYDKAIKYLNRMSKQELIEELIQVFDYGPEWIYNDFVKRNLY